MIVSEIANRYAKAIYELAKESGQKDQILGELRTIAKMFEADHALMQFFAQKSISNSTKLAAVQAAFQDAKMSDTVKSFLNVLAGKGRVDLFDQILFSFEEQSDADSGVVRGVVESAISLLPEQRTQLEEIVAKVTHKKAILNYKVKPEIIGGLVAKVGSYTFDDTIDTHLKKLNEDLKRRAH